MSWDPTKYPQNWNLIAAFVKKRAQFKCENCKSPSIPGKILTVHHLDLNPENNTRRNLVALCQSCHLHIQAKYRPGQQFLLEEQKPNWLKIREQTLFKFNRCF